MAAVASVGSAVLGQTPEYQPQIGQAGKDVIWVPTSEPLLERMLTMAQVGPRDVLFDLGSGDGRTVIAAAKRGAKAVGVEYDPDLVAFSRRTAERERLCAKGIHLDACSQFGIGFLSCFLGGQRIEVTTYRYGSQPLKIKINGPGKYFLIERLAMPQGEVRYNSPMDPHEDQPPQYAGTTIIVYLSEGWQDCKETSSKDIVWQTLKLCTFE